MSSKPSVEGVRSLKLTIDRLAVVDTYAQQLREEIAERQKKLSAYQEETDDLVRRIPKMLESMDVGQAGNFGFEARLAWALRELARQYKEDWTQ